MSDTSLSGPSADQSEPDTTPSAVVKVKAATDSCCSQRSSPASLPPTPWFHDGDSRGSLSRTNTNHGCDNDIQPHEHRKVRWWDRGLWQRPRLMVEEDGALSLPRLVSQCAVCAGTSEEERDMTWSELFFDLIFVTAIARLGDDLKESDINMSEYIAYFMVLWTLWTTSTLYATRFHSDDLSNKLYFALFMVGVIGCAMHIRGGFDASGFDNSRGFARSAAGIRILTGLYSARVGIHIPDKARHYSQWNACFQFAMGALWLVVPWVPRDCRVYLWWGNICLHYTGLFLPNVHCTKAFFARLSDGKPQTLFLPLHLEHFVERHGLVMIIVLGETINGLTQNPGSELQGRNLLDFYMCCFLGFVVVLCIKMLYFDVDDISIINHPLHLLADLWVLSNPVLAGSIAVTGAGVDLLIRFTNDREAFEHGEFSLSDGMTVITIAVRHALIKFEPVHRATLFKTIRSLQIVANVAVGICVCVLPMMPCFKQRSNGGVLRIMGAIAGCLLLCVLINLVDECLHLNDGLVPEEPLERPLSCESDQAAHNKMRSSARNDMRSSARNKLRTSRARSTSASHDPLNNRNLRTSAHTKSDDGDYADAEQVDGVFDCVDDDCVDGDCEEYFDHLENHALGHIDLYHDHRLDDHQYGVG